jgi:hypothetical protein
MTALVEEPDCGPTYTERWIRESAKDDPFGEHVLAESPDDADAILFAQAHPGIDPYLLTAWRHPLVRRRPGRCFLYHDNDHALPLMRGIYPSMRKRDYMPDRCRTYGYIARQVPNPFIVYDPKRVAPVRHFYSFYGENNSAVRARILAAPHPRGEIFDSTGRRHWSMAPGEERDAFMRPYAEAMQASAFVLCPRGYGPVTYRLYETMETGRVPVILSDDFVPPSGPAWEQFSVIIPEARAAEVGEILRDYEGRAGEMGRLAREAWENFFSKRVAFHRLAGLCADLVATPERPFSQTRAALKLLRPFPLRRQLRPTVRRWLGGGGGLRASRRVAMPVPCADRAGMRGETSPPR